MIAPVCEPSRCCGTRKELGQRRGGLREVNSLKSAGKRSSYFTIRPSGRKSGEIPFASFLEVAYKLPWDDAKTVFSVQSLGCLEEIAVADTSDLLTMLNSSPTYTEVVS